MPPSEQRRRRSRSGGRRARRPRTLGGALAAEAAALVAAALADPDLVALALEPRRPLADPVPAVGALGHVGADLGAAAPADDAQLRCLCHRARIAPRGGIDQRAVSATAAATSSLRSSPWFATKSSCRLAPVPPATMSLARRSSSRAADLGGARLDLGDQPLRHLGRRHRAAAAEVDQLALHPADGGPHLVVVDQLERRLDERLALVEELGEAMRERQRQRGEGSGVLEPRRLVEDPGLDRAEVRMRPHVPPQVGVVVDRARAGHLPDPARVDLPAPVVRAARPGAGRRGRPACAPTSSRCSGPPRTASSRRAPAAAAGGGGSRRRRRSPCPAESMPTWTWVPKISSRSAMKPRSAIELAVARALDDRLVVAAGERMGPGGADQHPVALGDRADEAAQDGELLGRGRDVGARRRRDLEDRLEELRLDLAGVLGRARRRGPPRCPATRSRVSGSKSISSSSIPTVKGAPLKLCSSTFGPAILPR